MVNDDSWVNCDTPCPKCGGPTESHIVMKLVGGVNGNGELTWEDWDVDCIGSRCTRCNWKEEY